MFYSLRGTIVHYDATSLAVECGGVAYHCLTTLTTLSQVAAPGNEVLLYTHMNIRQDAIDLFAFADQSELACFRMLIGVSGVGPRIAISLLSALSPEQLALCVASGDERALSQAPGVGKKMAQRLILELKDKFGSAGSAAAVGLPAAPLALDGDSAGEAISALEALGYSRSEAATAVAKLDPALPVEEKIKACLKALAGRL